MTKTNEYITKPTTYQNIQRAAIVALGLLPGLTGCVGSKGMFKYDEDGRKRFYDATSTEVLGQVAYDMGPGLVLDKNVVKINEGDSLSKKYFAALGHREEGYWVLSRLADPLKLVGRGLTLLGEQADGIPVLEELAWGVKAPGNIIQNVARGLDYLPGGDAFIDAARDAWNEASGDLNAQERPEAFRTDSVTRAKVYAGLAVTAGLVGMVVGGSGGSSSKGAGVTPVDGSSGTFIDNTNDGITNR
jgi:hypothetical protein